MTTMKTLSASRGPNSRRILRRAAVAALTALLYLSVRPGMPAADESAPSPGPHEQRIEVVMRNYDFVLAHPAQLRFGIPTVIILRNQDIVAHGFSSNAMAQLAIQAHGEGVAVHGKGIEGFHIDPGKTLAIHLVTDRSHRLTFNCDLHPQMKGELFVLEIPAA